MTKVLFTIPTLIIVVYLTAKYGLPWYVCFFCAWGVMDWIGMLHDGIKAGIIATK